MKNSLSLARPLILVFVIVNVFLIAGKNFLARINADQEVLIIGNVIIFVMVIGSLFMLNRSFRNPNPNAFVRAMYGSFIIKFFIIAIAAFVYIMITKKDVNKPALFISMGLYVVYTAIEVGSLLKLLKKRKNA